MPARAGSFSSKRWCRRPAPPAVAPGSRAQLHLALDYLFPNTIGRPLIRAALTRNRDVPHHNAGPAAGMRPRADDGRCWYCCRAGSSMAQSAGTVVGISGDCFVVSGGSRAALRLGLAVQVGDTVDVAATGEAETAHGRRFGHLGCRRYADDHSRVRGRCRRPARRMQACRSGRDCCAPSWLRSPGRQGSRSIPPSAPPRCARRTGLSRRSPARCRSVCLTGSVEMTSGATAASVTIPARWGGRLEAGRDPVPPRVWSQAEFDAVIARTECALKRTADCVDRASRGRAARAKPGWRCRIALGVMLGL